MKHYTLLSSYIFDHIYINKIIEYFDLDENELINMVQCGIDKMIALINTIKSMSENNIGGLFVILQENDNKAKASKDLIPEGLIRSK